MTHNGLVLTLRHIGLSYKGDAESDATERSKSQILDRVTPFYPLLLQTLAIHSSCFAYNYNKKMKKSLK